MSPNEATLTAESVSKSFSGVQALSEVSLGLAAGEIVGLIGPNGSGKTTLLNVFSGVYQPNEGRVICKGRDVTGWQPYRLARHGVSRTFQSIRLFAHLTVRENVAVSLANQPRTLTDAAFVDALLNRLDLTGLTHARADSLPYGVQRRVEIARALACRPTFLLLDEPAAGMNDTESDELLEAISAVRDDFECGILTIDHDLRLITRLCDRIHVLAEGRSLASGTTDEVYSNEIVVEVFLGTDADIFM